MSAAPGSGDGPPRRDGDDARGPSRRDRGDPRTRTRYPDGEAAEQPRRPHPVRALLTVVGVVALLVGALTLVNRNQSAGDDGSRAAHDGHAHGGSGDGAPHASSTRPSGRHPVKDADPATGVPTGYDRSRQGAESAAANYTAAYYSSDMFRADRRTAVVAALAAPSARDGLRADAEKTFHRTGKNLGLGDDGAAPDGLTMVYRTVPVGSRGSKVDTKAGTATVAVWNVTMFGLAGTGSKIPVTDSWGTTDVRLTWTGGDWKATGFTQHDGPAPVSGDQRAATAKELSEAVKDFGGFSYAR